MERTHKEKSSSLPIIPTVIGIIVLAVGFYMVNQAGLLSGADSATAAEQAGQIASGDAFAADIELLGEIVTAENVSVDNGEWTITGETNSFTLDAEGQTSVSFFVRLVTQNETETIVVRWYANGEVIHERTGEIKRSPNGYRYYSSKGYNKNHVGLGEVRLYTSDNALIGSSSFEIKE